MRKTAIIFAMALGFSITAATAKTTTSNSATELLVSKATISPFCMAIVKGDVETVSKFLSLGADVNEKSNGMTPAMYAAKYNRVEILKLLVTHGADLKVKSDKGMQAEKYAQLSNAKDVLTYMESLES